MCVYVAALHNYPFLNRNLGMTGYILLKLYKSLVRLYCKLSNVYGCLKNMHRHGYWTIFILWCLFHCFYVTDFIVLFVCLFPDRFHVSLLAFRLPVFK